MRKHIGLQYCLRCQVLRLNVLCPSPSPCVPCVLGLQVLLTLLHLNIQNIRIGPKLPAFITPNVLNVLVDKFKLTPIAGPDQVKEDMQKMLNA